MKPTATRAYQLHPIGSATSLIPKYRVTWHAHDLACGVTWPEARTIIAEHEATHMPPRRRPHHRKAKT